MCKKCHIYGVPQVLMLGPWFLLCNYMFCGFLIVITLIQVDLEYPSYLYDEHKDQPLAPEVLEITEDMLCDHAKNFLEQYNIKYCTQTRLTQNFYKKTKYVVHISNLKFYLDQGLVLDKIHRGVKFIQTKWLKPYIELNTRKRVNATSDFEKSFFKLLVNSIYGKLVLLQLYPIGTLVYLDSD